MKMPNFAHGVFLVDFEFHPAGHVEGNLPEPVCMVVLEVNTGNCVRYWQDELQQMTCAPFPTGSEALMVAYYASAELDCFHALGWPKPIHVLDLYTEFRCLTNGTQLASGRGLVGAMTYFGLPSIGGTKKDAMRDLVLAGGPWDAKERSAILDYCEADVRALESLLAAMHDKIDWPRAFLRGSYMKAVSGMQCAGVPIDLGTLEQLRLYWSSIQDELIQAVDQNYGVYEQGAFRVANFESYLKHQNIDWPRHDTGRLDLAEDVFREMARRHPKLQSLHQLRVSLAQLRMIGLTVGTDARNRCLLSPFSSKTGRNQPSTTRFIYGPAAWLRGLIKPATGFGLAYIDYSQQEFGIAAALSGDQAMKAAYESGDPYLAFAIQAGAAPPTATKHSHGAIREQYKACVLAVQYGMGAQSLALRLGQPTEKARQLLEAHQRTYPTFWRWSDDTVDHAQLHGSLTTVLGWCLQTGPGDRAPSIRNFPMQANGAEMLRLACVYLMQAGITVCAPVHDALLIEAPLDVLEPCANRAKELMTTASKDILGGFPLRSDVELIRYPDRYGSERGLDMWNMVMDLINKRRQSAGGTPGSVPDPSILITNSI